MIWAFENDTSAIIKKLAKKSVKFDRKKNLFCLIAIIVAVSMVMMSLLKMCIRDRCTPGRNRNNLSRT